MSNANTILWIDPLDAVLQDSYENIFEWAVG